MSRLIFSICIVLPLALCRAAKDFRTDKVNCEVWFDEWSTCSKTCGEGMRTRHGKIETQPLNGGIPCPVLPQVERCNVIPCISKPQLPINCERRPNGLVPHPTRKCSKVFYSCANGETFEQRCPRKLYYHADKKMCEAFSYVPACSGNERPSTTTVGLINTKPTPHPDLDCRKLDNGNRPDPKNSCSKRYFSCANGMTSITLCPGRLYYDDESKTCQPWINVYACSNIRVTPPPPTNPPPTKIPEPVPIDCSNLKDGDYADPETECSERFYSCSGGVGSKRRCAGPTFFDPEIGFCDTYSYVPICSGNPRPVRPNPNNCTGTSQIVVSMLISKQSDGLQLPVRPEELKQAVADTLKALPHLFVDVKFVSPGEIHFTSSATVEQALKDIRYGGGEIIMFLTNQKYLVNSISIISRSPVEDCKVPRPPYPFDCTDKANGNHPAGKCESFFWVCVGGETAKQMCPGNLKYDDDFDRCDTAEYLPQCGGTRPPVTPEPSLAPPEPTPEFDCEEKPDGMYTLKPCAQRYFTCSNGETHAFHCPGNLYFDIDEGKCNIKAKIVSCKHAKDIHFQRQANARQRFVKQPQMKLAWL